MTGAQANNWKNADNYTVTEAYIDGTVKAMVVDMKGAKLPGATSDKSYAVILSDIMSGKDNTQIADLWTSEGPVEEATINGDDLKKNMVYEFTMNGDEYDLEAVTETVVGVITEIDGEYITVKADGQAAKEYILTDDTIQLFVDTDKGVGSTEGTLAETMSLNLASTMQTRLLSWVMSPTKAPRLTASSLITTVSCRMQTANLL